MITIEFTKEEMQALHYERFHHPHPRVQLKMEAIWLKSQELPHNEICRLTCISKPTFTTTAIGIPLPSVNRERLVPFLSRSVGLALVAFHHLMELWLLLHRHFATATGALSNRHRLLEPLPTFVQKFQAYTKAENSDKLCWVDQTSHGGRLATGCLCEEQKKCLLKFFDNLLQWDIPFHFLSKESVPPEGPP